MALSIRPAREADLEMIANIAAAAFNPTTDAISRRLFPPDLQPTDMPAGEACRQWRAARKSASFHSDGTALMVAVDDALQGQIVGFALWDVPVPSPRCAPHQPHEPEPEPAAHAHAGLDQSALAEMRRILAEDARAHFGAGMKKNVWHLDYIAVDPRHRRRGIGKMLLQWGVQRAAAAKRDCYLVATPAGRPLYEAAGFTELTTLLIFGVPHWSMIKRYVPVSG
ncbi:GNAT family N-acetyltransferase [Aspergillus fischeri NRRL 181]|uniref:GNAT family acetyltransferase, putative n=1 Tax=Neosartorya fischeri (strain ATCC 1020 / DSM 3700 / CBS 544.65 / FGSC A1164 / JCM 1740 / NRRL 181 / WB 181) TaxID=331117 RepID=A1DKE1_NEOFI|nr:GNAT family acetyltransferase, putative [Aspergillus fischeri NRRL 181]EAW17180.1 GNAT family acetyltransferase, putative [Aspergillus fischeri NRRL 181]